MQQKVTTIADATIPEDSPFWIGYKKAELIPEEFDAKVLSISIGRTKEWSWSRGPIGGGKFCWATLSKTPFENPYQACHSGLQHMGDGTNCFVFNIMQHRHWLKRNPNDDKKVIEAVVGFYDWLSSTTGPFGPAMEEAILFREKTTGLVLAHIWPDATKVPKIEAAAACLNSRDLTEHAGNLLDRFTYYYHYDDRKDAAFAFLAARVFDVWEQYSYNYCGHNGYEPGAMNFSKHYINNKYNQFKPTKQWTYYVNKIYMEHMFQARTLKSFVKRYDEVKAE